MRQKELVELAMQTMNVSRDQAAKALDGVFSTLARALKEGDGKVPVECPVTMAKRMGAETMHAVDRSPRNAFMAVALVGLLSVVGLATVLQGLVGALR